MIILDLATEIEPVWKRTEAFYGKPWIWNMLHNFGGNISLFGRIDGVAAGPPIAYNDPSSGKMKGIGLTMEGIEQNPVRPVQSPRCSPAPILVSVFSLI